jgi:hypothetical protein
VREHAVARARAAGGGTGGTPGPALCSPRRGASRQNAHPPHAAARAPIATRAIAAPYLGG